MRLALAICAMLALGGPPQTLAHAFVDHAEPRVGSTVPSAPAEVRIWFTQEIEGAFSTASVRDASGKRVNKSDSQVDPKDRTVLRVALETLPPGVYTVVWRVVSVDTHVSEGDFMFKVGQ